MRKWEPYEIDLLNEYYPIGGIAFCQDKGLYRSYDSIQKMVRRLNLKYSNGFTIMEIKKIQKYYPIGGPSLCQEKGVNKDRYSIFNKVRELEIKNKKGSFENWEIDILKQYYSIGGYKLCQKNGLLRYSKRIEEEAEKLNLFYYEIERKGRRYIPTEIQILKKYYPIGGVDLCIKQGLNRESYSIKMKALQLHLKYRDNVEGICLEKDLRILKNCYPVGGADLCRERGVEHSEKVIDEKAKQLGLKREMNDYFNKKELSILKSCYPIGGAKFCKSSGLYKTIEIIDAKAKELGLVCKYKITLGPLSVEEKNIIRIYYPLGGSALCQIYGVNRSLAFIDNAAYNMNVYINLENINILEREIIVDYYPLGGAELCREMGVHKDNDYIDREAKRLGLFFEGYSYTEGEKEFMDMYSVSGVGRRNFGGYDDYGDL